jgi:hypothetical protein
MTGVELETPAPAVDATVVEPVIEVPAAADPPPVETPPEAVEPEPVNEPRGAVKELIELRKEVRDLRALAQDPAHQRLTPEIRQALAEGRILIGPPAGSKEAEAQRLSAVADKFGLTKQDANGAIVPDLDAARRVDSGIRDTVREEMRPLQEMTLRERATHHVNEAITYAEANGYDVETIRQAYAEVMGRPGGAELLSQPEVARQVWYSGVGRAVSAGKIPKGKAPAPAGEPARRDAPIPPTPGGRRAPGSSPIQLQAGIQAAYDLHKMDPAKGVDVKTMQKTRTGAVEL